MRSQSTTSRRRRGRLAGGLAALSCVGGALAADPPVPASAPDAPQRVEVVATVRGALEQKTLAQLLAAQAAFAQHHALAPQASLAFRLYARRDPADLPRLHLYWVSGDERRPVPLDDRQRFVLDPAWDADGTGRGALLQTNLPDGAVAWKIDVRTPGVAAGERRLGDLRLECEADMFHGNLQRGIRAPGAALLAAQGELCTREDDAEIWFAEEPLFGVELRDGMRRWRLPYRYVHCSDGSTALGGLFDWPYALRDRSFFLPLEDTSWPDDTRVVLDAMAAPQPDASGAAP